ncbi:MAG: STAS domain-containing protein [Candidatus Omnitrophica bacterium]|nr:STAS domain-containing protein [Candidatus Omnitrophota bacterium]
MQFYVEDHGLISVLYLKGDLSFRELEELGSLLHKVIKETNGPVIVDVAEVGRVDTTIAGQFIAAHREAHTGRREMVLTNVTPPVGGVLKAAHADHFVEMFSSTEEAIAELTDRHHLGDSRKVVANIKCGHNDCVFYTYSKFYGQVVPSCQYQYPEEISNGPNCRCYRVNWNQHRWSAQTIESPFQRGRKKGSLYEARDKVTQEMAAEEANGGGMEEEFEPSLPPNPQSSGFPMSPSPEPPVFSGGVVPPSSPVEPIAPPLPSLDPFADVNFPSVQAEPAPAPVAPPAPRPSGRPKQPTRTSFVFDPPPSIVVPEKHEEESTASSAAAPAEREEKKNLTPEEVVRHYLAGWNEGRFAVEYRLLSKKSRTLSMEEYCNRRRALRAQQLQTHGKSTIQEIGRVDQVAIEGDHAQVEITRVDRTPLGAMCYAQHFSLALEDGEWRIRHSEVGEERKNPIPPATNRTMKADAFLGKEREIKKRPYL